jgi:hypothetical protein
VNLEYKNVVKKDFTNVNATKRLILSIVLPVPLFFLLQPLFAQVIVNTVWNITYGVNSIDTLFSLTGTADGGFLLEESSDSEASCEKNEVSKGDFDLRL